MVNINITFKDILAKQREGLRTKSIGNSMYRKLSVPFTYLFLKLGITPNAITLFTYFLAILGYIFLTLGTFIYLFIGAIFFILFYTIDSSDGDVARITNQKSLEGLFFDEVSHYVWAICLGVGLGIGLSKIYQNSMYISLGLLIALAISLEHAVMYALRSFVRKGIIDNKKKVGSDSDASKKLFQCIYGGRSWAQGNFIVRILGIYPFNGLLYSVHFFCPIIVALIIIDLIIINVFDFKFIINDIVFGILPLYLLLFVVTKIGWVSAFLYKMEIKRYITHFIKNVKV